MNIRELNLFLNLSTTLHFGQSSRSCNITRSGLTRTIQRLEQELGEQLFLRDNRSVVLTRAGELFRDYAEDVIQRHRTLQIQMAAENHLQGELSLYCSVTAILSILPRIIKRFRHAYPGIHLNLQTGDAAMALPQLEGGKTDITIAALPDQLPGQIIFLKILETPLIFIAPRTPEEFGLSLSFSDWSKVPVIMPEHGLSRSRCERWFSQKKMTPSIYSYVAGNEALIAMVAMGCGIGVVPQLVLENSLLKDRIRILDTRPTLTPFTVGACTTKASKRLPIVQAFWQIAEQESPGHITIGGAGETHSHYQ
jgi:LysR family positive regulator for ilvC